MIRNYTNNIQTRNYMGAFSQEAEKAKVKRMNERGDHEIAFKGVYNIIFANDLLSCEVTDFISILEKSGKNRHEVKQLSKKLKAEMLKYEKDMFRIIGDRADYFADSADKMCELVQKDRDVLFWSIKQVMDDRGISDTKFRASVIIVDTIAQYACEMVDIYVKHISKEIGFSCDHLYYLKLDNVRKITGRLVEILCKVDEEIKLEENERCRVAFEVFTAKMANIDNIKKATDYED